MITISVVILREQIHLICYFLSATLCEGFSLIFEGLKELTMLVNCCQGELIWNYVLLILYFQSHSVY